MELRTVRGEQQGVWPRPIVRCGAAHQRSDHGQGFNEIRRERRVGLRSIQRRQTGRYGAAPDVLSLSPARQSAGPCFYPLLALMSGVESAMRIVKTHEKLRGVFYGKC